MNMPKHKKLILFTDGGARGNPGPAGIGAAITTPELVAQKEYISTYSEYIGEATNNQAEYKALILGLEKCLELEPEELEVRMDSELIVKQLQGKYKVKNPGLAPLFTQAWNKSHRIKKVSFHHIPREQNKEADRLVNLVVDKNLE